MTSPLCSSVSLTVGAGRHHADGLRQFARVLDRLAVDRGDHVAGLDAGLGGRTCRLRLIDQRALGLLQAEAVGDVGGDRLDLHAEPGAVDVAVLLELRHDHLRGLRRDVEADADRAAGRREDRGVDADHVAVDVEGRTAGITLVDRRIDLDVVVVGAGADVAAARRDDAGGDGAAQAERIADRDHPVADARLVLGELHIGEGLVGVDLDEGKIGLRIGADHLGLVGRAVVGLDLHGLGVIDDVVIGHRVAVRRNEEARAFAGDDLLALRHAVRHCQGSRIAGRISASASRAGRGCIVAVHAHAVGVGRLFDLDADRDDRRLHLRDQIGKSGGRVLGIGGVRGAKPARGRSHDTSPGRRRLPRKQGRRPTPSERGDAPTKCLVFRTIRIALRHR